MSGSADTRRVAARIAQTLARARRAPLRQVAARVLCEQARRLQIPIDTGRLRASLTVPGHPEQEVTVTQTAQGWSATLASRVPYAPYQIPRLRRRGLDARAAADAIVAGATP